MPAWRKCARRASPRGSAPAPSFCVTAWATARSRSEAKGLWLGPSLTACPMISKAHAFAVLEELVREHTEAVNRGRLHPQNDRPESHRTTAVRACEVQFRRREIAFRANQHQHVRRPAA